MDDLAEEGVKSKGGDALKLRELAYESIMPTRNGSSDWPPG